MKKMNLSNTKKDKNIQKKGTIAWTGLKILGLWGISVFLSGVKNKLFRNKRDNDISKTLDNAKYSKINMANLVSSIHDSKTLYKELAKKCHPDRFINRPEHEKALSIFQEITENKHDFEKLARLKELAIKQLKI